MSFLLRRKEIANMAVMISDINPRIIENEGERLFILLR
jgi:hypothetical protein